MEDIGPGGSSSRRTGEEAVDKVSQNQGLGFRPGGAPCVAGAVDGKDQGVPSF